MTMILPRHVQMARQAESAAVNIQKSRTHRIDSDDWATTKEVQRQLDQLIEYIGERKAEDPDYRLPSPTGWKVMTLVLTIPEASAGGVLIVDEAREQRSLASPQGIVLALGSSAYTDPDRFDKPWLEIGDRTVIVKYDAHMFQLSNGQRLGFINDTQPVAVIDRGWTVPC